MVLLTGANGFLGRFLLLDLLQRVARRCVTNLMHCVSAARRMHGTCHGDRLSPVCTVLLVKALCHYVSDEQ